MLIAIPIASLPFRPFHRPHFQGLGQKVPVPDPRGKNLEEDPRQGVPPVALGLDAAAQVGQGGVGAF